MRKLSRAALAAAPLFAALLNAPAQAFYWPLQDEYSVDVLSKLPVQPLLRVGPMS